MLTELRIRNFALVEDGALQFKDGMTAFTGETGAGKSLLLDAITLLLGAKARSDLVRSGAKSAEVEGVFDLSHDALKRKLASDLGFEVDVDEGSCLLIRREISSEEVGKNRIWIQGRSATRAQLQSLLGDWVEVSGQHEFLRLNREDFVLGLVDQYGGLKNDAKQFAGLYASFVESAKQLESIQMDESTRHSKIDYLRFQVEELERAGIGPESAQEEEKLIALRSRLGSLEKIRGACEFARHQLEGLEDTDTAQQGILNLVQNLSRELRPFATLDAEFVRLLESVDQLQSSALELSGLVNDMSTSLEADPEALENAESRLSLLNRIKRKYALDLQGLLALLETSRTELAQLSSPEKRLEEMRTKHEKLKSELNTQAQKLHTHRSHAASAIQNAWQKDLAVLGMKHAKLKLDVKTCEELRPTGLTKIEALFSANPGEGLKPLAKVASGGELSRILLALKHIIAGRSEIGVYLFDEVDAGIGGETAHAVGARLRAISNDNQVLVVTHLAQVAASAHEQFRIEKRIEKGRMRTFVEHLSVKDRSGEIARMLGGTESKAAQSLAKELLKKAAQVSP